MNTFEQVNDKPDEPDPAGPVPIQEIRVTFTRTDTGITHTIKTTEVLQSDNANQR